MIHIFEIPDPNLPIHFFTFRALRRRLSPVIGEKRVFILLRRLYAVHCACAVSRPVHWVSPKATRNNFVTSNCLFTIQLLWGYDDD